MIRYGGVILVLSVWYALSGLKLVDPLILPTPFATFLALFSEIGNLIRDLGASVFRLLVGFLIGASIGILLGILLGIYKNLYKSMELVVDFFRSLPVMTIFPLAMIIFGLGNTSKIALTTWTVLLFTTIATIYGIRQVPEIRLLSARILGTKGIDIVLKVYLPSAAPSIVSGLRLSVSLGLVVVIVTEMFTGTDNGLGKRIYDYGLIYETPLMYSAIILTGLLGYIINKSIVLFEKTFIHWAGK